MDRAERKQAEDVVKEATETLSQLEAMVLRLSKFADDLALEEGRHDES